jgi:hypothetical protein
MGGLLFCKIIFCLNNIKVFGYSFKMLCQYTRTCRGNAGKACRNKAVCQDKWCKKHDKKKCLVLAQDEVFGMPEKMNVKPAAEKNKFKFSVFHKTVNSQSDFSQMTTD